MIEPWEEISTTLQGDFEVFRVHRGVRRSPRTGREHVFHLIESVDWVNILPVTPDGQFVMIEQYRHGIRRVTLEIPGGLIDATDADPAIAARREMAEETGYDTTDVRPLGVVSPNPAVQTNQCHSFVAYGAVPAGRQELDAAEEIRVTLVDPTDVPRLVREGRIAHALVIAAFYLHANDGER